MGHGITSNPCVKVSVVSLYSTTHCSVSVVVVSFSPTTYTVTEGVDEFVELILVRSGVLSRATVVIVTTRSGTATGVFFK